MIFFHFYRQGVGGAMVPGYRKAGRPTTVTTMWKVGLDPL
jgi:hypothetical protein